MDDYSQRVAGLRPERVGSKGAGMERRRGLMNCWARSPSEGLALHGRSRSAGLEGPLAGRRPRIPRRSPHFQVMEVEDVENDMQEARAPAQCGVE